MRYAPSPSVQSVSEVCYALPSRVTVTLTLAALTGDRRNDRHAVGRKGEATDLLAAREFERERASFR
ncbi:MAG: hypothetical protein ACLTG0_12405 [Oscillibacter sp.]